MYADIVRIFPVVWNSYFKCFQLRFRCRCPHCHRINKHGQGFDVRPHTFTGTRGCDWCRGDYSFVI